MDIWLWPAASGEPWDWGWRAYLGVWCLLGATAVAVWLQWRRTAQGPPVWDDRARLRRFAAAAGWLVLWLALDWPLGALAGSLLAAASLQYLLISLVAAPLLLWGLPRRAPTSDERAAGAKVWRPPVPLLAGAGFAAVLFGTSIPTLVDSLRATSLGSLLLCCSWLVAALGLWWPVLRRDGRQLRYMPAVAYLFVPFILPKVPGLVYIVAPAPLYRIYQGAPRVAGLALSATADQRTAGAMLWSAGTAMIFVSLGLLFFAWYRDERRSTSPASLQIPADPELVAELFAIPGAWLALERVIGGLEGSLPEDREGCELRVTVRQTELVRRVTVELHAPLDGPTTTAIEASIARDLTHYLARMPVAQRQVLEAHLAFEVVPFRTRAG